ncbi:TPA: L-lactate dehydrogenase [Streptococcus suis]|nr:L-lactate dehydrogenase [Streptococcus suis]
MTRKIGIIGLGHVGATLLHDLIAGQVFDSYVVIDKDEKKVASDVLDMKDRVANTGYFADFVINDYSALSDADIVVSSLGNILLQANAANSRFAELPFTSQEVKDVSKKLVASGFSGILIVITNPVDVITQLYQTYTGFPKEKVIGTGTLLDTARMMRAVGEKFGVSPVSVSGYNLGEHGNSQFTAWSQVRVNQTPIQQLVSTDELSQLADEARVGGHTVFFGKGYTNFAIAAAAKTLIEAVLSNSRVNLPVSHYLESLDTYIGYPALVGRNGIEDSVALDLLKDEWELLERSAQIIRERVDIAKTGDWDQLIL